MKRKNAGFTLLEITLVIVVMGILAAVIVPRAMRAREDAKFSLVRQAGAELAQWGATWAERALLVGATSSSDHVLGDYVESLFSVSSGTRSETTCWTGDGTNTNWTGGPKDVNVNGTPITPPNTVSGLVPDPVMKNPFNGASYFDPANSNGQSEGQLKLCKSLVSGTTSTYEYYFLFTGFSPPNWYGTSTTNEDSSDARVNSIFMGKFRKN
jgi:prepilin-type N-terminal cleavage/methylation domain-containing protein